MVYIHISILSVDEEHSKCTAYEINALIISTPYKQVLHCIVYTWHTKYIRQMCCMSNPELLNNVRDPVYMYYSDDIMQYLTCHSDSACVCCKQSLTCWGVLTILFRIPVHLQKCVTLENTVEHFRIKAQCYFNTCHVLSHEMFKQNFTISEVRHKQCIFVLYIQNKGFCSDAIEGPFLVPQRAFQWTAPKITLLKNMKLFCIWKAPRMFKVLHRAIEASMSILPR